MTPPPLTFRDILRELRQRFTACGIETPVHDAELLVMELAGLSRPKLLALAAEPIAAELLQRLREAAARRETREPLQYILGHAWFRNLALAVTPAVLIPRPETELLAGWIIEHLPPGGAVLDVGTGSGAIALAVAEERPDAVVAALDVSPTALEVATANRDRLGLGRVRMLHSDLMQAVAGERFDCLAANLPYVTLEEYTGLQPEVKEFEPQLALTAPDTGMALIGRCIAEAPDYLNPGGGMILEMSPFQTPLAAGLLHKTGAFTDIAIMRDYTGRDRFVTAIRNPR